MVRYIDLINEKIDEQLETAMKYGFESHETQKAVERTEKSLDKLFAWAAKDIGRKSESLGRRKDPRHSEND